VLATRSHAIPALSASSPFAQPAITWTPPVRHHHRSSSINHALSAPPNENKEHNGFCRARFCAGGSKIERTAATATINITVEGTRCQIVWQETSNGLVYYIIYTGITASGALKFVALLLTAGEILALNDARKINRRPEFIRFANHFRVKRGFCGLTEI
jgi:hypothetical protein